MADRARVLVSACLLGAGGAARSIGVGSHAAIELADPDDVRAVAISSDIPMLHERLAGQRRAVCFAAGVEFFAREEVRGRE